MNVARIVDGYLEAIAFTECHCDNSELQDAEFSPQVFEHAQTSVRGLVEAFGLDLLGATGATPEQIGHDLWLNRNGHGAGFWDRPELYGPITSEHLDAYARALGQVWAYVGDDGFIYVE